MSGASLHAPELPGDWQERLRERLLREPDHRLEGCYFVSGPLSAQPSSLRAALPQQLSPAAVLLPIVLRAEEPTVLLTVRASHLRAHPGQISFPGGQMEADDADPAAAAVRETTEELGIGADAIEPVGFLADHIVRTGYRVTPVVALLQPGFTLRLERTEVADAFELPLRFVLGATNYRAQRRSLQSLELQVWELSYGERLIWGATAGMLAHLREVLSGESPAREARGGPAASGERAP